MDLLRRIFQTNYFPNVDKYFDWLRSTLGWLVVGAMASLLVAVTNSKNGWWMFAFFVAVIALQLLWPWLQLKGCSATLDLSTSRIDEEEEVTLILTVVNRFPIPLLGICFDGSDFSPEHDPIDPSRSSNDQPISLSVIPPKATNQYRWKIFPKVRGEYPKELPKISSSFPFGIWNCEKPVDKTSSLIVRPRTVRLWETNLIHNGNTQTENFLNIAGDQGDILGSRKWQEGEPLRMIHWPQSARSEEDLFVIEKQTPQPKSVRILFNPPQGEDKSEILNWMVRFYASLACHFHSLQYSVQYLHNSHWQPIGLDDSSLGRWLDSLATHNFLNKETKAVNSEKIPTWFVQSSVLQDQNEEVISVSCSTRSLSKLVVSTSSFNPLDSFARQWKETLRHAC